MKLRSISALVGLSLAASCAGAPTYAQEKDCAPRHQVLSLLTEKYEESRQSIGMADSGVVVETFASASGSWSITATLPSGITCLVASGQSYENLADPFVGGDPT